MKVAEMQTVVNGALSVHHTDTVDTPWDATAAVAAMPNDPAVLKYCHAWVDSNGKPDAKGSYKFPHATKDGGPANLAACRNGLARLPGSNIPAADKPGVERHLKAHLADGGSDADNHHHHHVTGGGRMDAQRREWFQIRNADDGPTQVYLYDEIGGGGWLSDGIAAADFVTELTAIKASAIDLHINSPGGDVFDAIAIYNALRRHPATVTSYIDGIAASAASFIAQAGDKVVIERNAQFMLHDASGMCWGNAADMAKMVDLLNKASDNIADIYAQRSGVDQSTWRDVMKAEAWYSSSEAVLAGLADSVAEQPVTTDARLRDVSRFDLKALGARYASRGEAPDPPLPSMRLAAATRDLAPAVADSGLTAPAAAVTHSVPRPAAHAESDVMVAQAPARTLTAFEQEIVDVVRSGFRARQEPPTPPPVALEPALVDEPVSTAAPEGLAPFDPAVFRAAVKAGLRAH
jgi:ATP-dependent protease ClpP protease subunit